MASKPTTRPTTRRYWSGFTVCLFVVLLSVFTWVVHRRLTQYESPQQAGGHHLIATKVCLTDRNRIAVPTTQATAASSMFVAVVAWAGGRLLLNPPQPRRFPRPQSRLLSRARRTPCLAHFFFLPPPFAV